MVRHIRQEDRRCRARRVDPGVGALLGGALLTWAVLREARRAPAQRRWNGQLAGFIPYDLRAPSMAKVRARMWAPDDPRIVMPRVFGIGWTLNLGRLARLLRPTGRH
jgi:uncharacterized protein DUF5808